LWAFFTLSPLFTLFPLFPLFPLFLQFPQFPQFPQFLFSPFNPEALAMNDDTLLAPTPATTARPSSAPALRPGGVSAAPLAAEQGRSGPALNANALALSAAALAACGGGGGGGAGESPVAAPPPPTVASVTPTEASRFLGQAAFGGSDGSIARVQALGYSGWLEEQFASGRSQSHHDWMVDKGYAVVANVDNFNGADNTLWRKLINSPDVLRQRVTLALSEIFVVSMTGLPISWRGFVAASYVDVLEANAFGSYRALLGAVTLSPGMGTYLNMRGNLRENPATGRVPDENYSREVLQLFSLGLVELAADGSLKNGVATDTYGQETITGLAKVFTGWDNDRANRTEPGYALRPMILNAANHSPSVKSFLGVTIAAGTLGGPALETALDAIANHANVGPFIGRQLIQRLVTSNPSAAYVGRVAAVFNNNGAGVRGDLKAVIKAVLLDDEARRAPTTGDTTRGKLREPVVRFVQWARAFKLASPTDLWNIGVTSDPSTRLGQSPLRSPSVFNFFRPGYVPPNTVLGAQNLTAPEFQITNESTVVGWANWAQTFVQSGVGETRPDYSAEIALATDAAALVNRVVLLLAPGALSAATLATLTTALGTINASSDAGKLNRVRAAVHLVLCAPEYLVQI